MARLRSPGACCSKECGRIILWMVWVTQTLVTSIYVALAVITFGKLWQAATEFNYGPNDLVKNKIWRAPLVSLALSALLVFGFNFMSCITLIKKSINRGGPGFGYGFIMAFSFSLSFFLLLCGLVLDGFRDEVRDKLEPRFDTNGTLVAGARSWSNYSTEGFMGALVMSLISFVVFFIFSIVLIVLQAAISEHLGIETAGAEYLATDSANIMTTVLDTNKEAPAAPPDYDQYAQYEQYGGYTADGQQQQQYYNQNGAGYQAPAAAAPATDGYYTPTDVNATPYAPADSAAYGFAPAAGNNTGLLSGQPNQGATYQYQNNQQI